ncbi:hypothetical protein DYQ86_14665 [Acidobacteria bacterium AB60]|nr:hypothetical protein DYQ86_14665 [Acidobacteria bacterium AB60]
MPIAYAGINPTLKIDTRQLQKTEKLSLNRATGVLFKNRRGVCISMVVDWIDKCQRIPGGVTDISELKSGLALSLAQTAYMRHAFQEGSDSNDKSFIENQGLTISTYSSLENKFFSTKKGRLQRMATALAGLVGYAYIGVSGDGGHALGYRRERGLIQCLDPNEGILEFNSGTEFAKWFPAYMLGEYPDVVDRLELTKIRG